MSPAEILFSGQFKCGMKASPVQVSFKRILASDCGYPQDFIYISWEHKYKIPLTACYISAFKTKALVCFVM